MFQYSFDQLRHVYAHWTVHRVLSWSIRGITAGRFIGLRPLWHRMFSVRSKC
jgi:hypothetical protein